MLLTSNSKYILFIKFKIFISLSFIKSFLFVQANRAFLEQQAIEREQEREDANEQHNKLSTALAEKEKEFERERMSSQHQIKDLREQLDAADKQLRNNIED